MLSATPLNKIGASISASQALPVIVGNYESCNVAIGRLTDLQNWIRLQASIK